MSTLKFFPPSNLATLLGQALKICGILPIPMKIGCSWRKFGDSDRKVRVHRVGGLMGVFAFIG